MAVDSAGYNTANAFSANNALATGLQQAAVYDPTTQNSQMSTSVAGKLNSANDSTTDLAPATQNLSSTTQPSGGTLSNASNNTAYPLWSGMSKLVTNPSASNTSTSGYTVSTGTNTSQQIVPAGSTQTQVQNPYYVPGTGIGDVFSGSSAGQMVYDPKYGGWISTSSPYVTQTVPAYTTQTVNNALSAPGAQAAQAARNGTQTDFAAVGGASVVSVRTSDGQFAYYSFNPNSGSYTWVGTYDKNGAQTAGAQSYIGTDGKTHYANALSDAQRASAQLQALGAGNTFKAGAAASQAGLVTQYNNATIAAWKTANATATANAQAAVLKTQTADVLAYMQANNGALPPQHDPGTSGANKYSDAAIAAAQTQYQDYLTTRSQEDANAALLGQYANKPIDTTAVDATSKAAVDAYNSIGASQGGGDAGAGSRLGAMGGAAIVGQGALNHQNAAAQSYLTNMQAFGEALQAQATTDANATETKLNADVQNVSDVAAELTQNLSQLDAQTQHSVKGQLDNLNNLVAQYQYAMQHFKDNTALIHKLAVAILAVGGAVATAATGGLAGIGIAAGTAAAAAAASKA